MNQHQRYTPELLQHLTHNTIVCVGACIADADRWITASHTLTTSTERTRAKRFVHTADAARHLAGRAIVRTVLSEHLQHPLSKDVACSPYGKPYFPDCPVHFSISHSGTMVWTAFSCVAPVGIDVEAISKTTPIEELSSALHPTEQAALPKGEEHTTFYRMWVRKEAVLKASGYGLLIEPSSCAVSGEITGNVSADTTGIPSDETAGNASGYALGASWLTITPHKLNIRKAQSAIPAHSALSSPSAVATPIKEFPPAQQWTTHDISCGSKYFCSVAAPVAGLSVATAFISCSDMESRHASRPQESLQAFPSQAPKAQWSKHL